MIDFIKINSRPWVTEFNQQNVALLFKPTGNKGVILFRKPGTPEAKLVEEQFKEVARIEKAENFIFVLADIKDGIGQKLGKLLSLNEKTLPHLAIIETKQKFEKHQFKGNLITEEMLKFVQEWKQKNNPKSKSDL